MKSINCRTLLLVLFTTGFLSLVNAHHLIAAENSSGISFSVSGSNTLEAKLAEPEYIVFEGSFVITGKYEFIYQNDSKDSEEKGNIGMYIYPDSLGGLPIFYDRGRPVRNMVLVIKNQKSTANMLLGKPKTDKLFQGEPPSLKGRASFVLEGLIAAYECHRITFSTEVMRIENVLEPETAGSPKRQPGC